MIIDEKLYSSLYRVYGSLTDKLVNELFKPPSRIYVRVNTMYISRDELIDILREKNYDPKPDPFVEEAIYFELKGPFNIEILDKKIYVNRKCAESIMYGANLYAPGVLKYDDFKPGDELTVIAPNSKPIAIVIARVSSSELKNMKTGLVGENVKSIYRAPAIRELYEYSSGLIYPQSLPSMIVSKIIDPKPFELIVDMNAAPGGKTSHIIQLTRGAARVLAFDRNLVKVKQLVSTLNRLRLFINTVVLPMDSRYLDADLSLTNIVDKVLVDPPCTDLGVRPKIVIDKTYRDVVNASNYQIQFLRTATRIVKPGGLIVYSTCTLTFEENEGVSLRAIREYGLEPVDLGSLPYSSRVEYGDLVSYRYSPIDYDMTGYYIILLRKRSTSLKSIA